MMLQHAVWECSLAVRNIQRDWGEYCARMKSHFNDTVWWVSSENEFIGWRAMTVKMFVCTQLHLSDSNMLIPKNEMKIISEKTQ